MQSARIYNKNTGLMLFALYAVVASFLTAIDGGDFDVFLDAAQKLQNHQNIYNPPFIKGLQYYYSVFFALILVPFSSNFLLSEFAWSLLSCFLLYCTFILVKGYLDLAPLTGKQQAWWAGLTVLLAVQFILYNISMVQITMFLLWAVFESINLISKGKQITAGALLGLAINIKIMPVLIWPYLFWRGHFKALGVSILTFLGLLWVPALFIGWEENQTLLASWWGIINPSNKEHLFETGIGTHSLVAMLPVYLTATTGEMEFQRNFLNLSAGAVELVINISRLLLLALSLFFMKSWPFRNPENKLQTLYELAYFTLLIPLLLPHQQKYAFLLALPMVSYLVYFFMAAPAAVKSKKGFRISLGVFVLCMLWFSPLYGMDVIGKFLFLLTQHYRVLTFATLGIIPVALYCAPFRLAVSKAGV